jgi:hypothetical protein
MQDSRDSENNITILKLIILFIPVDLDFTYLFALNTSSS